MASKNATASFALFDCSGPIRCSSTFACLASSAGHFAFASCTRFSPNTRWSAEIAGSMASGPKVFDTAINVISAGLRPASRQARTISFRTYSRPVDAVTAIIRWLYRNRSLNSTSNKRTRPVLKNVAASNGDKRGTIDYFEDAVFPTNRPAEVQAFERLVGVHQRHAERIREMLLGERKLDRPVLGEAGFLGSREQVQQQIRRTLKRSPPPKAYEMFIDELLFTRGEPCDVEGKCWETAVKIPQFGAGKYAQY